ncbi:hypothetical protein [Polaribacter aestuariivivens]|uniref:hypothetical protein n=1 Tax=Polaribacter aestuariivivens TaxID=2304626 RepID=UPI003F49519F
MKARAWLSMFLIVAISYTGFGNTTSDLTKNSTAVTISDYDVGGDVLTAIVVGELDFTVNDANSYVFSDLDRIESELFKIKENFEKSIGELVLVPPLINLQSDFRIYKFPGLKSKNKILNYRRARDCISCNFS